MTAPRDTIFAPSSGRPPAAIAVVRMSGPQSRPALETLIGRVPEPRKAALARVRDPATQEVIDEALVLWFPAPRSETGEDVAELQLHGGRAVIAAVLAALSRIDGLRPAEAGEFTRRAFLNGQLDLTAVEGLADLVAAETAAQRRQAFGQLKGFLGDRAETWRGRLIEALALVEAGIDFSDEADVPADLMGPALASAQKLADEIEAALTQGTRGERLREGLAVAIAGPPNAGKSTLLNRIAHREAAIVSPLAGTTRDAIEVHLDLAGYPVTLIDTAGIRASDDPVEQEGVRRARARAAAADLVLWVIDAATLDEDDDNAGSLAAPAGATADEGAAAPLGIASNTPARMGTATEVAEVETDAASSPWIVLNKIDLIDAQRTRSAESVVDRPGRRVFAISAAQGAGVESLIDALSRHAAGYFSGAGEPALITRERHRHALGETLAALRRSLAEAASGREDIVAEELRLAARALGRLTGRVDVEDVLDVIFRDFCIGK